jgi:Polysaccharide biosynthesis enzyme WcbI
MNKRWLVISNCQTIGIANSLSLLCPHIDVDICDVWKFRNEYLSLQDGLSSYDCLVLNPEVKTLGLVNFDNFQNVIEVPGVLFTGFHPDICYVVKSGEPIKGAMDAYHSLIIYTAYKNNVPEADVRKLFCEKMFNALSYYDDWETGKATLTKSFLDVGLDIHEEFIRWSRHGAFMHSLNHPKIDVLYDISTKIALKAGENIVLSNMRPYDNLANGDACPVYPEIGNRFGIHGDYYFKPSGLFKLVSIEQFISRSYECYKTIGVDGTERTSSNHENSAQKILLETL